MKKRYPTLLASTIWMALYSQNALADTNPLAEQCMLGVPMYERPLVSGDPNSLPVHIESDDSQVNYPASAVFTGNVIIEQGNRLMTSDQAEVHQTPQEGQPDPLRTVTATGNVKYDDNMIKLSGPKAWSNLNTKDTDLYEGQYQMVGRQGRGQADVMKVREANRYAILENGTFTSCLPGDNSWSLVGSEIIHDNEEELAEIWNARFKIGPVPVFYSPYLQFPTGNKRRSGFLLPNAKFSNNSGFEFALPYYWNIAPNFDATITPHYIAERGMQYQNEFRYLLAPGAGLMEFDWLKGDNKFSSDYPNEDNSDRWLFYWAHSGVMDQHWRFNVDYTKLSDYRYLSDFDSEYGSSTDGYATQKYSVGYAAQSWNVTAAMKKFQIFDQGGNANAYRAEPQVDFNQYMYDLGGLDLHTYAQVAKFTSENASNPKAVRAHLEPTLSLPLANRWGSIDSEVKLMATHYDQDIPDSNTNTKLKDSVNRVLPQYKVSGKVVFDRPIDMWQDYTQTLEPRVQYLYVPYKDQSDINIYDSTLLQFDYTGLFRDRAYSGLDRISSANQVTTGLTTRVYDEGQNERFNASIGQIYYFEKPRIGDDTNTNSTSMDKDSDTGSVIWAGDTFWKISPTTGLRGGVQYDTRLDTISVANAVAEYRKDSERVLQISYRYASKEYVSAMTTNLSTGSSAYNQDISQIGAIGTWPIADRWSMTSGYYYDTKLKQTADGLIGVQYNTCCWAVGVRYERKIVGWDNTKFNSDYDNKVSFNVELRGLSRNYNRGGTKMLSRGILPYQQAF
ncbi:LPS-assembly protein LptD [Leminorella grimontii]|uniref:LPS-assembly protein LptD n=1 Tax=Leminorella grimontii TaxID=82981 RepID=A0AAV5N5S4_9GAMM|nr:LPS assembly protein LptD [Leminorella grimontii]KFC95158.1 organic solvent tolerance protein [Leminorella grimontii ATCC 33999 = DSM 5078]GKX56243.1 LPS-assembly protein LptD [Leminorella grimontii]VFS60900.1 Organic solvent tolerance protein [Leminorella grimontii]